MRCQEIFIQDCILKLYMIYPCFLVGVTYMYGYPDSIAMQEDFYKLYMTCYGLNHVHKTPTNGRPTEEVLFVLSEIFDIQTTSL